MIETTNGKRLTGVSVRPAGATRTDRINEALRALIQRCGPLALAALVEVHDEEELDRALAAGARIVGVNSRNLGTLAVEASVLDRLGPSMPDGVIAVAESGLKSRTDLQRLTSAGYDAFLVGERLVTAADPGAALRELRGT